MSLAQLLGDADGLLGPGRPEEARADQEGTEPEQGGAAETGRHRRRRHFLLSTLDSVLPETTSILKTSRVVLTLARRQERRRGCRRRQAQPDADRGRQDGRRLPAVRDQTPHTLSAVDNLFADNSDTMVQLLGQPGDRLAAALRAGARAQRAVPGLPRVGAGRRRTSAFHDHGVWATAELYPRYTCDYGTPAHSPLAPPTTPSRSCTPIAVTTTPRFRSGAPRTRRVREATTPPVRRRGRTWAAEPIQPEGPLHNPHPLRWSAAADRTAALRPSRRRSQGDNRGRDNQERPGTDTEEKSQQQAGAEDGDVDPRTDDTEDTTAEAEQGLETDDAEADSDEPLLGKRANTMTTRPRAEAPVRRICGWCCRCCSLPSPSRAFLGWKQWQEHRLDWPASKPSRRQSPTRKC